MSLLNQFNNDDDHNYYDDNQEVLSQPMETTTTQQRQQYKQLRPHARYKPTIPFPLYNTFRGKSETPGLFFYIFCHMKKKTIHFFLNIIYL